MSIWIGEDALDFSKNTLCEGSPFLKIDDENNYLDDSANGDNNKDLRPWVYGVEAFCNL